MQLHGYTGWLAYRLYSAALHCVGVPQHRSGRWQACAGVAAASAAGCHTAFVLCCVVYNKCVICRLIGDCTLLTRESLE